MKVSVIVPVYNAENNLEKCLQSILSQTYSNFELLLINDGSTDNTEGIIKKQKDERIRYFSQLNAGPSMARNRGIEEAKGVYLIFVDADDWVTPDYIEKLIDAMITFNVDLVCAGYYEVNRKFPEGLMLHDYKSSQHQQTLTRSNIQTNLFKGLSGVLWAKIFKRDIFIKNGIRLNSNLRLSEDLIAVLEYSFYIESAYAIPHAVYYYNRLNDEGLSGKLKLSNYYDYKLFLELIEKYRAKLDFLDLDSILNKRKYFFMINILKDHINDKRKFFDVARFLVENESPLDLRIYQNEILNDKILKLVFAENYLLSFTILKLVFYLKTFKSKINL